tara:strand:- start:556 stop:753 length:198 start_codon:yes stop_codon:yes gene_type:complete
MPECALEFDKYVECVTKHPHELSKSIWCRRVLKELDQCMLNYKNPTKKKFTGEKFILKDIPPYVN